MKESWKENIGAAGVFLMGIVVFLWFLIGLMSFRAYFSHEYWAGLAEPSFYIITGVLGLLVVVFGLITIKVGRYRFSITYGLFLVIVAILFIINAYMATRDLTTLGVGIFLIPTLLSFIFFLIAGKKD